MNRAQIAARLLEDDEEADPKDWVMGQRVRWVVAVVHNGIKYYKLPHRGWTRLKSNAMRYSQKRAQAYIDSQAPSILFLEADF